MNDELLTTAKPIFALVREKYPEVVVNGVWQFSVGNKTTSPFANVKIVSRSLLKPWQCLATDVFKDKPHWAIALSSHSGQPVHLKALETLALAEKISLKNLQCPESYPLDATGTGKISLNSGERETRFHPCSGKHLAYLIACKKFGYSTANYLQLDHPLHQRLIDIVHSIVAQQLDWLIDSCGLPTAVLTLNQLTLMYRQLAKNNDDKSLLLKKLWIEQPILIGGAERLDTHLIEIGQGDIIAKEGADGLLAVQTLGQKQSAPQTVIIKLASGYNSSHLYFALWSILELYRQQLVPALLNLVNVLENRIEQLKPKDQELVTFPTRSYS